MPFDAVLVSLAVIAVFVAFAAVVAWADAQTSPSTLKKNLPSPK